MINFTVKFLMQLKCYLKGCLEMPRLHYQNVQSKLAILTGLFAIAFCTALAHGVPLSEVTLNQHTMQHHLIKCFEQLEMTPFQTM